MGQAKDARAVRVEAGVKRRSTWAALRRRAEAAGESDAAGGEAVEGRRVDSRLPVAAQVLAQIVAGQKQDVRRDATPSLRRR